MIVFKSTLIFKAAFVVSLVVFFLPLFALPFFNHAAADDYICGIHLRREGLLAYQSFIYDHWGGRFAATFTGSLFARNSFLYQHYYLHTLLLLVLNLLSLFFLFSAFNKFILKDEKLRRYLGFIYFVFIALQYVSLAEPSTYFFWFSSAITYQLPVILLQFHIGLWVVLFYSIKTAVKVFCYILIPIFIVVINGYNEIFIIVQSFLLLFVFFAGLFTKISKIFIVSLLTGFTGSALLVLLSPGNAARSADMVSKSLPAGIAVVCFHIAEVAWCILKNPLACISFAIVYLYANDRQERICGFSLIRLFIKKRRLLPLLIFTFLFVSIGCTVLGLHGSVLPDRYINAVILITIFLLLMLAVAEGAAAKNKVSPVHFFEQRILLLSIIIIGLLANGFVKEEYKSLVSAPAYNVIMNERETKLQSAAGRDRVEVKSYDTALQNVMTKDYANSSKTVSDWRKQKPSFLFFSDDLSDDYAIDELAAFYGIKKIVVK